MRWIDRGQEPPGVQAYGRRFTQGWVRYFQDKEGERPKDSHWREFRDSLGRRSGNVCWYCERLCSRDTDDGGKTPTIDHFRPLRRYPELAYERRNWIFSCQRCNRDYKGSRWPSSGYVDPSTADEQGRRGQHFDYDADTGEIVPRHGLSPEVRRTALQTIDDLGLNQQDVLSFRRQWTGQFAEDWRSLPTSDRRAFAEFSTRTGVEFAGATLMLVQQLQASEEI